MIKLGMKLFSTNCLQTPDFAASVIDYVNAHDDMFLELMAVPGSFEATHAFFGERVKASDVVVHNAHEAYDLMPRTETAARPTGRCLTKAAALPTN